MLRTLGAGGGAERGGGRSASVFLVAATSVTLLASMWGRVSQTEITMGKVVSSSTRLNALQHNAGDKDLSFRGPEEVCKTLTLHEGGRWQHNYFLGSDGNEMALSGGPLQNEYLPLEVDWLHGTTDGWRNRPGSGCNNRSYNHGDRRGVIYASKTGNQCGCQTKKFRPSDSAWVFREKDNSISVTTLPDPAPQNASGGSGPTHDDARASPTFALVERLARSNQSLCFAGDSIDLQFYDAMTNNLMRLRLLHTRDEIGATLKIERKQIPVVYTNETSGPDNYARYWMCMKEIQETVVTLVYDNGERLSMAIRYYKVYGWSPWAFLFMDTCDVISYTLGLHYDAHGAMMGRYESNYDDDFRAALTFLTSFGASRNDRVAVWRSVLPQHFNTSDGHFGPAKNCTPLKTKSNSPRPLQNYNRMAEKGFAKHCEPPSRAGTTPCDRLRRMCTMNATATDCRTLYHHLVRNNVTARAEEFRRTYAETKGMVTGNVLRWEIADLFDVPSWHFRDSDCSHFCYVPALYEEAFRRLDLLLSWAVGNKHAQPVAR
mmetsp:Transcript_79864/g.222395  ORF Transcript_79864/g.222395 Transcript_79864/m.222395 type:complete len:545 (+) Transcript_79864:116-1750(+)